jgi:eukaryotic-like serine/threonine-protein kinase
MKRPTPSDNAFEEAQRALELHRDAARLGTAAWARKTAPIGLTLFLLFDLVYGGYVAGAPLQLVITVRVVMLAIVGTMAISVGRRGDHAPVSGATALRIIRGTSVVIGASHGVEAALTGGFHSLYFAALAFPTMVQMIFGEPFRGTWATCLGISASAIAANVITLSARGLPVIEDTRTLALALCWVAFLLGFSTFSAAASTVIHRLRLQLYESRDIGRYRLERKLGEGGMGEVWAAYHRNLRREVALKILRVRPGERVSEDALVRFEREVRMTSELTHPNTVRVFDYGTTEEGLRYYAMELLHGDTLAALVAREGPLSAGRAIRLVRQAASALVEAHGRGVIHRDIKPENLFVVAMDAGDEYVKLLDFGVARSVTSDTGITAQGTVAGTPAYMAPEQIRGGAIDGRTDLYALGGTLYFAVTGVLPFETRDLAAALAAQLHGAVVPPSQRSSRAIPRGIDAVVLRCLEKRGEARFASAAALIEALDGVDLDDLVGGAERNPSPSIAAEAATAVYPTP